MRVLIEILNPIRVNGVNIIESFRLNLDHKLHQARCKMRFPDGNTPEMTDLVIFHYSTPRLDGPGLSLTFRGREMEVGKDFEGTVSFGIFKRTWRVKGTFDGKEFLLECNDPIEMVNHIKNIISKN